MNITYIKCKSCKNTVFSFNRHDFRYCKCKKVAIDGGFDYSRFIGDISDYEITNSTIKESIKLIRKSFTWGQNYTKDMVKLPETKIWKLKDMKSDHIVGVLQYISKGHSTYNEIKDIFFEELQLRNLK